VGDDGNFRLRFWVAFCCSSSGELGICSVLSAKNAGWLLGEGGAGWLGKFILAGWLSVMLEAEGLISGAAGWLCECLDRLCLMVGQGGTRELYLRRG